MRTFDRMLSDRSGDGVYLDTLENWYGFSRKLPGISDRYAAHTQGGTWGVTKTEDRYIREHTRPGVTYASDQERLRREYRAKYGGRGKYQRQVFQYAYTVYDRKG